MSAPLHLQQASMSWRDPDHQVRQDYNAILARDAHAVGFTEVYNDLDLLRTAARKHHYSLTWGPTKTGKPETVIATKQRLDILAHGSELVNPADTGKPPAGGHSARYATWVQFKWAGNVVFVAEGHWVTAGGQGREAKRREMSRVMARLVKEHAEGRALGFVMGDTNEDDNRDDDGSVVYEPFDRAGLVTIFDELSFWPPTHTGRHRTTIDIVASYEHDRRVKARRAIVHRGGYSDHYQVSAFYDVAD